MVPACRVTGTVTCTRLQQMQRCLPWIEIDVCWDSHHPITYRHPMPNPRLLHPEERAQQLEAYTFELLLPPGIYRLKIRAGKERNAGACTEHCGRADTT